MNDNVTVTVPSWVVEAVHLAQRNWIAFFGTILLCIVVIAVTALVKGHVNIKREEARAKKFYIKFTALFSSLLAVIASLAYFMAENMPVLKNLPYVGEYMVTVLGGVWTVYNAGLKFKAIEAKGAAWALKSSAQTGTATQPTQPEAENQFLGQ